MGIGQGSGHRQWAGWQAQVQTGKGTNGRGCGRAGKSVGNGRQNAEHDGGSPTVMQVGESMCDVGGTAGGTAEQRHGSSKAATLEAGAGKVAGGR
jgi:hypothetical protein